MGTKLILGDCEKVIRNWHKPRFDALITDPPYGIGFKYNQHDDTPRGYGKWLWGIIEQCESLLLPGSPVFVWQAMPNSRYFSEWFPRDYRIFAAAKNFVQMRPIVMQYAYDPVLVWWTEGGSIQSRQQPGEQRFLCSKHSNIRHQSQIACQGTPMSKTTRTPAVYYISMGTTGRQSAGPFYGIRNYRSGVRSNRS